MPEATGPISHNNGKLVDALAASDTFRRRIDPAVASQQDARRRIHHPHFDDVDATGAQVELKRPLAVVQSGDFRYEKIGEGERNKLKPVGSCFLILEDDDRYTDERNDKNGQTDFENFVGGVLGDLAAVSAKSDNISILGMRQRMPAATVRPQDEPTLGKFWRTVYEIDWGWV